MFEGKESLTLSLAVIRALEHLTVEMPEELVSGKCPFLRPLLLSNLVFSGSDFPSDGWDDNSIMGSDSDVVVAGSP